MLNEDLAEVFDSKVHGLGIPVDRQPEKEHDVRLPKGCTVVSADGHWTLMEDIFFERFPEHLKHRAPRIVANESGYYDWIIDGKRLSDQLGPAPKRMIMSFSTMPGAGQLEPRLQALDAESVDKELIFGNEIALFFGHPDLELREAIFRAYNEYLADLQKKAPGRIYGVGLINYWDMSRVRDSIQHLKSLGLKTFWLPVTPKGADQKILNYCDYNMDPLWAAIQEADLPICIHTAEGIYADTPGGIGTVHLVNFGPLRKSLGEFIFGGIFDRFPDLKVVFVESELNWVPGALQCASALYEHANHLLDPQIKHNPRYYWHKNCYATFMHDPAGLRLIDIVGADRALWSSDYPHIESTYGFGNSALQEIVDMVSEDDARLILGGNAKRVFGL